jgi:hypothetical protein
MTNARMTNDKLPDGQLHVFVSPSADFNLSFVIRRLS